MGWPARTEHAAAALVAVAVLHHDRLVGRLLDRLSGLAAADQFDAGRVRLPHPDRAPRRSRRAQAAARPDDGQARQRVACRDRRRSAVARLCPRAGTGRLCRQLRAVSWRGRWRHQGLSQSQRRRLAVGRQARRYRANHPLWRARRRRQGPCTAACRLSAATIS